MRIISNRKNLQVDLVSILSVDHACKGCARPATCCCARYEVCVGSAELNRIIRVLPEAARFCPHLKVAGGYDNVFEEVEPGLYAIDTTAGGLCVFAYTSDNIIKCALHAAASSLGLPVTQAKPKVCLLWPLCLTEDDKILSLAGDALSMKCNRRRPKPLRRISPALAGTIELIYGRESRQALEAAAARGLKSFRLNPKMTSATTKDGSARLQRLKRSFCEQAERRPPLTFKYLGGRDSVEPERSHQKNHMP